MFDDKSIFYNVNGVLLVKDLFFELDYNKDALYTFKPHDIQVTRTDGTTGTIYSIHRLYLEEMDPTEFVFANKYFASMEHWRRLFDNSVIRRYILVMRNDLEMKLRSQSFERISKVAADPNHRNFVEANKYINTVKWQEPEERKASRGRGRPTKKNTTEQDYTKTIENDYERLMSVKN